MKVFLTGATGYVGSTVAEKLRAKRFEVLGLARSEESAAKLSASGIEPLRGDLNDVESLKKGAKEADAVVHTAFVHDFADYDCAVETENAAIATFSDALAGTNKPFVATSGSGFLGDTGETIADEDYPADRDSPFFARAEAEANILRMSAKGVRSVVLRLPLCVYGRGGSSFVPFMIEQAKAAGAANYANSGAERVSAVHVEDAADLYVMALETGTAKGLYNVAAEMVTLKSLDESIARLLDLPAKSVSAETLEKQFGAMMFGFLSINNQLSAEKAMSELGWRAKTNKTINEDIEYGSYRKYKEQ